MAAGFIQVGSLVGAQEGTFPFQAHGAVPSQARVSYVFNEETGFPVPQGPVSLHVTDFDGNTITFPYCVVDDATLNQSRSGVQIVTLTLFDRRVWWQNRAISGSYNLRKPDDTVDTKTEKTPQQLAVLLLQSMGETGFDVTALPNSARPEVYWDYSNPAVELQALCDSLGCVMVLNPINQKVSIARKGVGAPLPAWTPIAPSVTMDRQQIPDGITMLGSPNLYQSLFELEPVALEENGSYVALEDASYKPANGWGSEGVNSFSNVSDSTDRQLAIQSVWRAYRVKNQAVNVAGVTNYNPQNPEESKSQVPIGHCLPLRDTLLEYGTGANGEQVERPAEVYGEWYNGNYNQTNTEAGSLVGYSKARRTPVDDSLSLFDVIPEEGVIIFDRPVRKLSSDKTQSESPTLYLVTSHQVLNVERSPIRSRFRIPIFNSGVGDKFIKREDVTLRVVGNYDKTNGSPTDFTHNAQRVSDQLQFYALPEIAALQASGGNVLQAEGIRVTAPDGAINTISWDFGLSETTTTISRNVEPYTWLPSYEVRANALEQIAAEKERRLQLKKERAEKIRDARKRRASYLRFNN